MRNEKQDSGFSRKEKQRFLTFRIVVVHCFYQEIIMKQNQGVDDRIAEQTTDESIEETSETPKGILYETSLRQAEKNAKKEKEKACCNLSNTPSAPQAQASFNSRFSPFCKRSFLKAEKPFGSSSRIWIWSPSFPPPSPSVPLYFGTSPSTVNSHLRTPAMSPKPCFWRSSFTSRLSLPNLVCPHHQVPPSRAFKHPSLRNHCRGQCYGDKFCVGVCVQKFVVFRKKKRKERGSMIAQHR